jgi:glycosyltransferase involved in cell wall biosynthesis
VKLVLASSTPYVPFSGGAPKANRILAEGLAANGHVVHVVALARTAVRQESSIAEFLADLSSRGVVAQEKSSAYVFELAGVHVHAVDGGPKQPGYLGGLIDELAPDWVLVSSEDWRQTLLAAALGKSPSRVVYLAHTSTFLPAGPLCTQPYASGARLLERVTAVVAPSRWFADYIAKHCRSPTPTVIPPLFEKGPFPQHATFDSGHVTMINPCDVKGISIFLALAREFPEVRFAAVPLWGTTENDRHALLELPNVRLLPQTERIDDFLSLTKVMLIPSLWHEVFGLTAVETMLRGIPVMASDSGGLPEAMLGVDHVIPVRVIERYGLRAGVPVAFDVPAQDLRAWRSILERLLRDRSAYSELSARARDIATRWVANQPIDQYLRLLRSLEF